MRLKCRWRVDLSACDLEKCNMLGCFSCGDCGKMMCFLCSGVQLQCQVFFSAIGYCVPVRACGCQGVDSFVRQDDHEK